MTSRVRPSFARHLTEEPDVGQEGPSFPAGNVGERIAFPSIEQPPLNPALPSATTLSSHQSAQSALTSSDKLSELPPQSQPQLHQSSSSIYRGRSPTNSFSRGANRSPRLSFSASAGGGFAGGNGGSVGGGGRGIRTPSTRSPTPTRAYHRSFDGAGPMNRTTSVSAPNIASGAAPAQIGQRSQYTFTTRARAGSESGGESDVGVGVGGGSESPTKRGHRVSFDSDRDRERSPGPVNVRHGTTTAPRQPPFPVSSSDPGTLAHAHGRTNTSTNGSPYNGPYTFTQRDRESLTSLIASRIQQLHDATSTPHSNHSFPRNGTVRTNNQNQNASRDQVHRDSPRPPSIPAYNSSHHRSRSRTSAGDQAQHSTNGHANSSPHRRSRSRLDTVSASSRAASPLRSLLERISLPIHGLGGRAEGEERGRRRERARDRKARERERRRRERAREEPFVPVDPWRVVTGTRMGAGLGGWTWKLWKRKAEGTDDVERQAGVRDGDKEKREGGDDADVVRQDADESLAASLNSISPADIESLNLSCPVPSCTLPLPFCPHFTTLRRSSRPLATATQSANPTQTNATPLQSSPPSSTTRTWFPFIIDTVPRQVYLHCLLRLPRMYFGRVARIFEDADLSRPDVGRLRGMRDGDEWEEEEEEVLGEVDRELEDHGYEVRSPRMGQENRSPMSGRSGTTFNGIANGRERMSVDARGWDTEGGDLERSLDVVSPALVKFKRNWENFVDSLIKEWKTFNLVSALLLSAILTMFQIPTAAADPLVRTPALLSMVCALMSLCYGCVYIVRFGTMRGMARASRWADEAQKTKTSIFWNVWVLLAAPAIWLAWSMIAFIVSILAFVWRSGSTTDPSSNAAESSGDGGSSGSSPNTSSSGGEGSGNGGAEDAAGGTDGGRLLNAVQMVGPRVAVTAVVVLGLIWFALIVRTFKRYGDGYVRRHRGRVRDSERRTGMEEERERLVGNGDDEARGRTRVNRRERVVEPVSRGELEATGSSPVMSQEMVMSPASSGVQGLGLVNMDGPNSAVATTKDGEGDGVFVVGNDDDDDGEKKKDELEVNGDGRASEEKGLGSSKV